MPLLVHDLDPVTSLDQLLRQRAERQPERVAFTYLTDGESHTTSQSYGEIDRRARAIAVTLRQHVGAGDRALIAYDSGLDFISAFFGCLYAGVIAVPVAPPRRRQGDRTRAIAAACQAAVLLASGSRRLPTNHSWDDALLRIDVGSCDLSLADAWHPAERPADGTAFLQFTSGSTAQPRGVVVTHANLLHNQASIRSGFATTGDSSVFGWLPLYHDMGLIGTVIHPIFMGIPCVLMSPTHFVERPIRWLRALSLYRSTISGGPNFAFDLCVRRTSPEDRRLLDLSHWKVAFNGAEPVRPDTLRSFASAFTGVGFRSEAFYPCYGLAEATLFVAGRGGGPAMARFDRQHLTRDIARPIDDDAQQSRELVAYDPRGAGHDIRVVAEDGSTVCASGEVGEIWVAGPSVANGYWDRPEETASTFRARLASQPNRWFLRTGDLGFISSGQLFVAGRAKDLIILRGRNLYPDDIERSVDDCHPLVRRRGAVAFSIDDNGREELVIVSEVERRYQDSVRDDITSAIRQVIAAEHEAQVRSVALVKFGEVPRTSSGKVQRRLCKSRFLDGTLNVLSRWTFPFSDDDEAPSLESLLTLHADQRRAKVLTLVQETIARLLGIPAAEVDLNISPPSLGVDSLMLVELKHRLEQSLDVRIANDTFAEDASLAAAVDRICELLPYPVAESHQMPAPNRDFALSSGQRALWVTEQIASDHAPDVLSRAVSVRGQLDATALLNALHALARRHSALRTTIRSQAGEPLQTIRDQESADVIFVDAASWGEQLLHGRVDEELTRPMRFEGGLLFRARLFRRSPDHHVLVIAVHHGIADYVSARIILTDLEELYAAARESRPDRLPPLTTSYADYVAQARQWLGSDAALAAWDFWRQELTGAPRSLELPADRVRPAVQTYRGDSCWCELDPDLADRLQKLARANGVTLFAVLGAAYFVFLHRHTGQSDILIGVPVANRGDPRWRNVVGYFVNLLPIRGDVSGDPSFVALLQRTAPRLASALAHQDLPFPTVVERLRPPRDLSRHPLVQCSMVLLSDRQNARPGLTALAAGAPNANVAFHDLSLSTFALARPSVEFDLSVMIAEASDGLVARIDYNTDLFEAHTIQRLGERWKTLLRAIVTEPGRRVSEIQLVPPSEVRQILAACRGPDEPIPALATHRIFEQRVANNESLVADEESAITFDELNRRANQLAHYLCRVGVGAELRVGLCVGRSTAMLVAALAVMKSGSAYVALDPSHPPKRLAWILDNSAAAVIITDRDDLTVASPAVRVIHLGRERDSIAAEAVDNLSSESQPDQAAYVMYTSGSTGVPHGVVVSHRSLVNLLQSMRRAPGLTATDRLLSVTTLAFDIAGLELFLPLITGASLMIASQETVVDAARLGEQIERWRPTVMQATPATWRLLLESGWAGRPDLKVLCGGEALTVELASRLRQRCAAVWNMYGPTETTVWSTTGEIGEGVTISLGTPIDNTDVHVLDTTGQPVPLGVSGELYIGGEGLARGYLGRADLTAERFVPNPFSSDRGRRLYRTGDRVRRHQDGTLEFLGRTDHQLKLRGFRIDPAEIEEAITMHTQVRQCVVSTRQDGRGDKVLVAYVAGDRSCEPMLRTRLAAVLPAYMVPSAIVFLPALPLTPNGKVDRRALSLLSLNEPPASASPPPADRVERTIADIWCNVLNVDRVGVNDNFFDLGGHSLLVNQVRARLNTALGRDVPVIELFRRPTIRTLAQLVAERRHDLTEPSFSSETNHADQRRAGAERLRQLKRSRDHAQHCVTSERPSSSG
jgi:amino acid adenylation domain-containing protein